MEYKVALIILYDREKKFLLQHRSKDAKLLPDHWAFFGGEINRDEVPDEAVRREAYEELNYKLKNPEFILEQDFIEDNVSGHMYVYIESLNTDKEALTLREGQGWGWYSKKEMSKLKMISRDRKIISFIVSHLKSKKEVSKVR